MRPTGEFRNNISYQEKGTDNFLQDLSMVEQSLDESGMKLMLHNPLGLNKSYAMDQSYNKSGINLSKSRIDHSTNRTQFVELGQKQRTSEREYYENFNENNTRDNIKIQTRPLDPHALSTITDDTKDLSHLSINNFKNVFKQKDNSYLNISSNTNANENNKYKGSESTSKALENQSQFKNRFQQAEGSNFSNRQIPTNFSLENEKIPEFRQSINIEDNYKTSLLTQPVDLFTYVNIGLETKSPRIIKEIKSEQSPLHHNPPKEENKRNDHPQNDSQVRSSQLDSTKGIPKASLPTMRSTNKEIETLLEDLNYLELSRISSISDNFLEDDEDGMKQIKPLSAKASARKSPLESANKNAKENVLNEVPKMNLMENVAKKAYAETNIIKPNIEMSPPVHSDEKIQTIVNEIKMDNYSQGNKVTKATFDLNQPKECAEPQPINQSIHSSKRYDNYTSTKLEPLIHIVQPLTIETYASAPVTSTISQTPKTEIPKKDPQIGASTANTITSTVTKNSEPNDNKGSLDYNSISVSDANKNSHSFPKNNLPPLPKIINNKLALNQSYQGNERENFTKNYYSNPIQYPQKTPDSISTKPFLSSSPKAQGKVIEQETYQDYKQSRIFTPVVNDQKYEVDLSTDKDLQTDYDYQNLLPILTPSSTKGDFTAGTQSKTINLVQSGHGYNSSMPIVADRSFEEKGSNLKVVDEAQNIATKAQILYKDFKEKNAELNLYLHEVSQSPTKNAKDLYSLGQTMSPSSNKGEYLNKPNEDFHFDLKVRQTTQGFSDNKAPWSNNIFPSPFQFRYSVQDPTTFNSLPSEASAIKPQETYQEFIRQDLLQDIDHETSRDDYTKRPLKKFSNPLFKKVQLLESPKVSTPSHKHDSPLSIRNYQKDSLKLITRIFDQPKTTKAKPIFSLLPPSEKNINLANLYPDLQNSANNVGLVKKPNMKENKGKITQEAAIQEEDEEALRSDRDYGQKMEKQELPKKSQAYTEKSLLTLGDEEINLTIRDEQMNVRIPISYYNPARDLFKHTIFGFNVKKERFIQGVDERKITLDNMEVICINCQEFIKASEVDRHSRMCDKIGHNEKLDLDDDIQQNIFDLNKKLLGIKEKILFKLESLPNSRFFADKIKLVIISVDQIINENSNEDKLDYYIKEIEKIFDEISKTKLSEEGLVLLIYINRVLVIAKEKCSEIQYSVLKDKELIELQNKIKSYETETVKQKAELEIWKHQAKMMNHIKLNDDKNLRYVKAEFKKDNEILSQIQSDIEYSDKESSYDGTNGTSVTSGVLPLQTDLLGTRTASEAARAENNKVKFYSTAVNIKLMLPANHSGKDVLISDLYEECLTQKLPENEWENFIKKKVGYQG